MKNILIFQGGWDGHQPALLAERLALALRAQGHAVTVADSLACLDDAADLAARDLIVPLWTMGQIEGARLGNLVAAVRAGTGLGGCHGGMGDAFRGQTDYEWMVGGHFVGHPHVGAYRVELTAVAHPITEGLPASFEYTSEQYYMLVDPAITVLADTLYTYEGRRCRMPVIWTKPWGSGRVYYNALGHDPKEFLDHPHVWEMLLRGLAWAAR